MSTLSDQLNQAMDYIIDRDKKDTVSGHSDVIDTDTAEISKTPGFAGQRVYMGSECLRQINIVYRKHAGAAPFSSAVDALERTQADVLEKMVPLMAGAVSDGIQMAQEDSFAYRKFRMFKALDKVFSDNTWRIESDLISMPFLDDYDCREYFERYIVQTIGHTGVASGYIHYAEDDLAKIWDLWILATSSAACGLYAAGYRIGQQWKEANTLAGIMAATEEKDD